MPVHPRHGLGSKPTVRRLPQCGLLCVLVAAAPATATTPNAMQMDIAGPAGSQRFGSRVAVLPNGNLVVADTAGAGAVHLYSAGGDLISTLTGSTGGDHIGMDGIHVLADGDFLVASTEWTNPQTGAVFAGALTRVDGEKGLFGTVSELNSLVGSQDHDLVGGWVRALPGGGYVALAPEWDNGAVEDAGAAVVVPAGVPRTGSISGFNALVGSKAGDRIGSGGISTLDNGNIVLNSPEWDNGPLQDVGAATWVDTQQGLAGVVSATNSLIGSTPGDRVGSPGTTALGNGNYVVASTAWSHGGLANAGAATWCDGATGCTGEVGVGNSLVGVQAEDAVGWHVQALANGHYIVSSPRWDADDSADVGAVTWGDGVAGTTGPVASANSITGSKAQDQVGSKGVLALANGHYVVLSPGWTNGSAAYAGAATWAPGDAPTAAVVAPANSLIGVLPGDRVGTDGQALANGNYVIGSPRWNLDAGAGEQHGAVTWGNGVEGITGPVSPANSLVGSRANDRVGMTVLALDDGNYVVLSPGWDNASTVDAGAATWADGSIETIGVVGPQNSLIGSSAGDLVGNGISLALQDGGYVVSSPDWNGPGSRLGAVTVVAAGGIRSGVVGVANSLHGSGNNDSVGPVFPLADGNVVSATPLWDGAVQNGGAVTLVRGDGSTVGPVGPHNSVVGEVTHGGPGMAYNFAYDPARRRLAVGLAAENRVTLLWLPAAEIFASGFEHQ